MKLSILIASYGPQSQQFIDLAYKSLEAQTFQDFEVIHVSSGDFKPVTKSLVCIQHFHSNARMHYPEAISRAYEISDSSSEFIFLMNDDVILHKDCLKSLVEISEKTNIIANPMSSCCNGRFYQAPLGFFDKKSGSPRLYQKNQYKFHDMSENVDDIIHRSIVHSAMFFYTNMVCFFATMMRRTAWEKLGGIDTKFKTGYDDQDMSLRARKVGIPCGIVTNAFCFHFSGTSADLHLSQEDRAHNVQYFNQKHGGKS